MDENEEGEATEREDERFMGAALDEARRALQIDEVPVGAVVVVDGVIVGRGHNRTRTDTDPTAHAEVLAIRDATRTVGDQRLRGGTLYSTVEPCFMCAGAASHARVERIVFGVRDPKFGACGSLGDVPGHPGLNHASAVREGVAAEACRELMVGFFRSKRAAARSATGIVDRGAGRGADRGAAADAAAGAIEEES
ncbi:tRNA-specific adenosine deaminase [Planctomycetes bacterium Pla163]|uniref:tRNA-specific adenosine deaminase n=1 Tax=Rohdeia mirabilis TaxID=2528008 RepID=A0A518D2Q4_9BACT|nr:tRNA-specific adenosine deaminase [Planctomycetes bacterium Pla163]